MACHGIDAQEAAKIKALPRVGDDSNEIQTSCSPKSPSVQDHPLESPTASPVPKKKKLEATGTSVDNVVQKDVARGEYESLHSLAESFVVTVGCIVGCLMTESMLAPLKTAALSKIALHGVPNPPSEADINNAQDVQQLFHLLHIDSNWVDISFLEQIVKVSRSKTAADILSEYQESHESVISKALARLVDPSTDGTCPRPDTNSCIFQLVFSDEREGMRVQEVLARKRFLCDRFEIQPESIEFISAVIGNSLVVTWLMSRRTGLRIINQCKSPPVQAALQEMEVRAVRLQYPGKLISVEVDTMLQHRDLSLKDISLRFWTKLDESLHDQLDKVVIALSSAAGDKCHEYRFDEVAGFRQNPNPVRRLLLDWADKKKATIADLENFLSCSREFGEQPLELLRRYCDDHTIIDGEYLFQETMPAFPNPQHKVVKRDVEETIHTTFQDLIAERGQGDNLVTIFITGPPACGKTQVCRKYATAVFEKRIHRNRRGLYLPVLLWKAGSMTDLANSLRDSLKTVRNPDYLKRVDPDLTVMHTTEQVSQHHLDRLLKEVLKALKEKYSRRPDCEAEEEWLIVIDGASAYDELIWLMPSLLSKGATTRWGRGKLLIAMQERLPVKCQCTKEIRLGPGMSDTESLEYLRDSFPKDEEKDLRNVAEQLSHVPLSLAVAVETMKLLRKGDASYSWQMHLGKYLLPSDSADVVSSDRRHPKNLPCEYSQTLYQALRLAVQRFGVEGNNAQLFFFLGLCDEGTVPLHLLKKLIVFLHGDEEEAMEDALFAQFNVDILQNCLGLILLDGDAGISVHHVLHVVLRDLAHSRLKEPAPVDESHFETRSTVSAIIKALCAWYQSIEEQSQGSFLKSLHEKLRLLPHFLAVFENCIQSCGYMDCTVPRFALVAAQLLHLRREGSKVRDVLETGIAVAKAVKEDDILVVLDLKSLYAKELMEVNEFSPAIALLEETIMFRKEQDKLLQEVNVKGPTQADFDQYRRNFEGLHRDLLALGYAFKDRGDKGDLFVADKHVAKVFELLQRGRSAHFSGKDWNLMCSEALLLKAQLYQDLHQDVSPLVTELLEVSGEGAPASHHNCQVLRTLTDLLLENGPQHNVDKAGLLIDRAIDMGHHLYGEAHPMLAYSIMTKGKVLLERGESEEALKFLAEAQRLNDKLPAEIRGNVIVSLIYFFQRECYIQQGRYKEAYDILKESAQLTPLLKVGFGPDHPQNTFVMDKLGQVCMHLMQLEEAKKYLEESLRMKEHIRGKSHPELVWNYLQLENVAYECNNDDEALMFRAKRLKIALEDKD